MSTLVFDIGSGDKCAETRKKNALARKDSAVSIESARTNEPLVQSAQTSVPAVPSKSFFSRWAKEEKSQVSREDRIFFLTKVDLDIEPDKIFEHWPSVVTHYKSYRALRDTGHEEKMMQIYFKLIGEYGRNPQSRDIRPVPLAQQPSQSQLAEQVRVSSELGQPSSATEDPPVPLHQVLINDVGTKVNELLGRCEPNKTNFPCAARALHSDLEKSLQNAFKQKTKAEDLCQGYEYQQLLALREFIYSDLTPWALREFKGRSEALMERHKKCNPFVKAVITAASAVLEVIASPFGKRGEVRDWCRHILFRPPPAVHRVVAQAEKAIGLRK